MRLSSWLAGGVLGFGALVRMVGFLQNGSLTGDEAMLALNIGGRSFGQLLEPLDYAQLATVPFLWVERVLALAFGVSEYSLRLLPLIGGITLVWVVYRLGQKIAGETAALVTVAFAATAFPLIRYSVEVKPYMIDGLVSAILIWMAVDVADHPTDRFRWIRLGVVGILGVLTSTPALLSCAAILSGLLIIAVRRKEAQLLLSLPFLGAMWGVTFWMPYAAWYAPTANAPYMRVFWAHAFLRPSGPDFLERIWQSLGDLACTMTCWRGVLNFWPALLLLGLVGLVVIIRGRGPEYGLFLAGPIGAAFLSSALGRYPLAPRLLLFTAPNLALLLAMGSLAFAQTLEQRWPRLRSRWVLLLLLYPSVVPAATLAFAPPTEWGIHGEEVRPLVAVYDRLAENEPVYVFPRAVPAWVFHTTRWTAPDTVRLRWVAHVAGPDGPGFVNGPSRGMRTLGDGADLIYPYGPRKELYGNSTGAQGRSGLGYVPPRPDPGWAENEVWRMRSVARPYLWIVLSDYAHGSLDERAVLMHAVARAGGSVVYMKTAANAALYRVRFEEPRLGVHGVR
jgi:Dolichyl-phosphate-mannose-protein mannosyltransferase